MNNDDDYNEFFFMITAIIVLGFLFIWGYLKIIKWLI